MEPNENHQVDQNLEGLYKIRLRKSNWEVEVSAPDKAFVLAQIEKWVKDLDSQPNLSAQDPLLASAEAPTPSQVGEAQKLVKKPDTLREFINGAKFASNLEKILTFGYWCEIKLQQKTFTDKDIIAKFKEIKEDPPANIKRDLASLQGNKGFLMTPEKGQDGGLEYQLSNSGMKAVEALLGLS